MDCIVLGVAKSWTRLSNSHFQNWIRASQVVLVVKNQPASAEDVKKRRFNPWVGKIPWRKEGLPTLVFLPGKSHGQRILAGYKEPDMIE